MSPLKPAYSPTRRAGDLVFVSGQLGTGEDELGDVRQQTATALERLEQVLQGVGATRSDVVKCTVFLHDLHDWAAMNEVYGTYFQEPYPSRSAVGAELVNGALVEIEAVAFVPSTR